MTVAVVVLFCETASEESGLVRVCFVHRDKKPMRVQLTDKTGHERWFQSRFMVDRSFPLSLEEYSSRSHDFLVETIAVHLCSFHSNTHHEKYQVRKLHKVPWRASQRDRTFTALSTACLLFPEVDESVIMKNHRRLLGLVTILLSYAKISQAVPCSVCPDGTPLLPEDQAKLFTIPGFEAFIKTCGDVEDLAPTQDSESDLCLVLHSLSTFCGCPIVQENHCQLCEAQPIAEEFYDVDTGFTSMADDRLPTTCGLVEATLNSISSDSAECTEGRQYAGTCGCPGFEPGPAPSPTTPTANEATSKPCSLCHDGGAFEFPEKDVSAALEEAGLLQGLLDLGLEPKCQVVSALVGSTLVEGSRECADTHVFLGGICGCAPIPGFCDFCPNDEGLPDSDTLLYPVEAQEGFLPSCGDMNLTLTQIKESDVSLGSKWRKASRLIIVLTLSFGVLCRKSASEGVTSTFFAGVTKGSVTT